MINIIEYPITLLGNPRGHKTPKTCFLVLQATAEINYLRAEDAPIAMRADTREGSDELRSFEGNLYRRTEFSPAKFGDPLQIDPLDDESPLVGRMSAEATRRYLHGDDPESPAYPKGYIDDCELTGAFKGEEFRSDIANLVKGFRVHPDNADYAKATSDKMTALAASMILVGGVFWSRCTEMAYAAIPASDHDKSKVVVVHEGYASSKEDDFKSLNPIWSNPDARFFSASDREEAAGYAGIPLGECPVIEVFDEDFLKTDFEKAELARCAGNVLSELWPSTKNLMARIYLDRVRSCLKGEWKDGDADETIAFSLTKLVDIMRRKEVGDPLRDAFDAEKTMRFVDRWADRPIELDVEASQQRAGFEHKWEPTAWKPPTR